MNPRKCSQLILFERVMQYNEIKTSFSTNGAGTGEHPHAKKKKYIDIELMPFTKINPQWTTNPNVKC